jgi:hypothetical protein
MMAPRKSRIDIIALGDAAAADVDVAAIEKFEISLMVDECNMCLIYLAKVNSRDAWICFFLVAFFYISLFLLLILVVRLQHRISV